MNQSKLYKLQTVVTFGYYNSLNRKRVRQKQTKFVVALQTAINKFKIINIKLKNHRNII